MERELVGIGSLETVYFEANPLQLRGPAVYRNKVRLALPQVKQIDASEFPPMLKIAVGAVGLTLRKLSYGFRDG